MKISENPKPLGRLGTKWVQDGDDGLTLTWDGANNPIKPVRPLLCQTYNETRSTYGFGLFFIEQLVHVVCKIAHVLFLITVRIQQSAQICYYLWH